MVGHVGWNKASCYTQSKGTCDLGECVVLKHIAGEEVNLLKDELPANAFDLRNVVIHDPVHERYSFMKVNSFNLPLHEKFSDGKGPNHVAVVNEKGKWLADTAARFAQQLKKADIAKVWSGDGSTAVLAQTTQTELGRNDATRGEADVQKRKERLAQRPAGESSKRMKIRVAA